MKKGMLVVSGAAIAAATMGLSTGVAYAQETQAGASAAGGDIVVTARRREEKLQDVPLAVTALSGDSLQRKAITDVLDLGKSTPGLNVGASPRGNSSPFVVLRGQRVQDTAIVHDSPVLFYVNEIPWMRMNGINQAFYDIENIQVLRGPQGTLFGKSTTGGAILINTKKPVLNETEGYLRLHLGDYSLVRGEGALNVPLVQDRLAMRIAAVVSRRNGFVTSRTIPDLDLNNEHYDAERLSLHYQSDGLTNDLIASRFSAHDNGSATQVFALNESAPSLALIFTPAKIAQLKADIAANANDFYHVGNDFNTRYPDPQTTIDVTNITSIPLSDSISIKNVFGYRNVKAPVYYDFDGSSVAYQQFYSYAYVKQISDELQIQGTSTNFDWIIGAFYLREHGDDGAIQTIKAVAPATTDTVTESGTFAANESYSAFISGTYRFGLEGLSLTAGARISHDKREGDGYQRRNGACTFVLTPAVPASGGNPGVPAVLLPQPCLYHSEVRFTKPSWQVSLNYKLSPGALLYVAHRHGYRSGGVQNRATTVPSATPFSAEMVNDVEFGGKFESRIGSDTSILFNAAVYKAWYSGLQRILGFTAGSPPLIVSGVANAADATITGVELESRLRTGGFELSGSLGYTDPKFKNFSQSLTPQTAKDLSNSPGFSSVPKWTWTVAASYTHELSHPGEALNANVSANHVGTVSVSEVPVSVGQYLPAYTLADARIGWTRVAGSNFDLAFSVTNMFDTAYANFANSFATSVGWATRFIGAPRRVQGSVTYNF